MAGDWYSTYDALTWETPGDLDVDHVVALSEAFQSGAYSWDLQRRTNYANDLTDPRTLAAVTDNVNASKGDRDPANWIPPNNAAVCDYIGTWISIKIRWSLTIDPAERNALTNLVQGQCAGMTIGIITAPPN